MDTSIHPSILPSLSALENAFSHVTLRNPVTVRDARTSEAICLCLQDSIVSFGTPGAFNGEFTRIGSITTEYKLERVIKAFPKLIEAIQKAIKIEAEQDKNAPNTAVEIHDLLQQAKNISP